MVAYGNMRRFAVQLLCMDRTITPVIIPNLGETVEFVRIIRWHKRVGDRVAADEGLAEVLTDKTDVLIESPITGTIVAIDVAVGERVLVGARIAAILGEER
jgi:pyruvate/2-oxoglutarate dehydrogenase complex dihydrolipoamide acyltransferase (E2) component